jgi:hypothetical protein
VTQERENEELVRLEERGWQAPAGGDAATCYEQVLDNAVVMLLPGGLVLDGRGTIIASMSGPPWSAFRIAEPSVLRPTADTGVVTYGIVARRGDAPEYSALVSSLYVRRPDGWTVAFHQQTPRSQVPG